MSFSHKLQNKSKRDTSSNSDKKGARFLITINVFGSAGPLRFVVNGDDNVSIVIQTALKLYAREGRIPLLGSDINCFLLYPSNSVFHALELSEEIGSHGVRNFVLCKMQKPHMTEAIDRKGISGWRTWLHRSFSLKITQRSSESVDRLNSLRTDLFK